MLTCSELSELLRLMTHTKRPLRRRMEPNLVFFLKKKSRDEFLFCFIFSSIRIQYIFVSTEYYIKDHRQGSSACGELSRTSAVS